MQMTARLFLMILLIGIRLEANIEFEPAPIEYRFNQASVVCRGVAVSASRSPARIKKDGTPAQVSYSVVVSVERLYKGPTDLRELTVAFPADDQMSSSPLILGEYYLLFLRVDTKSTFSLVNTPGAHVPLGHEALSFPARFSGVRELEADVIGDVDRPERTLKALEELTQFRELSPEAIQKVQNIRASSAEIGILRLALLARWNPTLYLPDLANAIDAWGTSSLQASLMIGGLLEDSASLKNLPELERFATVANPHVRQCAMDGIRHIKDPAAIPFLIKQLDYPNDTMTEYLAVTTLAEIVHKYGEFGPGMGPFERNPAKYIALWKQWWHDQGNGNE